jgi:two-component system, OmpR family, sensor histidine kinase CreC
MRNRAVAVVQSLSVRIFLGYFLVLGVAGYAALNYFSSAIKPAVRQTMEETMVEEVNLLAELVQANLGPGETIPEAFGPVFRDLSKRDLLAVINGVDKRRFNQRVYVTDAHGIVRFDSTSTDLGADYTRWNNVKLAMAGKYGARSTHSPGPEGPSTMHVSAAIYRDGSILGVVTVAKHVTDVDPFLKLARARLLRTAGLALVLSLGVGLFLSWLLSRSVSRLVVYAEQSSEGQRVPAPKLQGELGVLAGAMERMRTALEGKAYVEQAMQTFAHEMKSPLSGILAAAELLEGDLAPPDRVRFASQVEIEARRMQLVLERLLELAVVEQRQALRSPGPVRIDKLLRDVTPTISKALDEKGVLLRVEGMTETATFGEALLLHQAFRNLLDNAVDFANRDSEVVVSVTKENGVAAVRIHNSGPAIPEFAKERLFERFYSLPRPGSGRRSQGLGLPFVREVTELHGGTLSLRNETRKGTEGVTATWTLPLAPAA